jgi:tetratricopeptide (TPR) repeat protein
VGITANNLAAAYYLQSKVPDAVRVQDLALKSLTASVGPDHQRTIVALSNLATFKTAQGSLAEAASDYRDLLARQTRLQGPDHPVTARVLISLATVLDQLGMRLRQDTLLAEAEGMIRSALATFEAKLGSAHPQVGTAWGTLGANLLHRNKGPAALEAQQTGIAILRAAFGEQHVNTASALKALANAQWVLGHRSDAIVTQRQATRALEKALGPAHRETANARAHLCDFIMIERGDAREALDLCAAAVATLESGPPSANFLQVARLQLANAHLTLGHYDLADSLLRRIRAVTDTGQGGAPYRQLLDSLAVLLRERSTRPARP